MSAKADQMGPKKKADSTESLPGLRFPMPVMERLSLIQGSSTHTQTHTDTHTHRPNRGDISWAPISRHAHACAHVYSGAQSYLTLRPHRLYPERLLSKGLPRQDSWSRLPFPTPRDLLNPGTEPTSPALAADSLPMSHPGSPCTQAHLKLNSSPTFLSERVCAHLLSHVLLFTAPQTVARQAPLSMGFSRQECWR